MRQAGLAFVIIVIAAVLGCGTRQHEQSSLRGAVIGPDGAVYEPGEEIPGVVGGSAASKRPYIMCVDAECPKCGRMLWLPANSKARDKIKCEGCGTVYVLR